MLHTLRQLYDRGRHSETVECALAAARASALVRSLARNRETVRDALGWFGWGLAGVVALFAAWEIGGFAVLIGQEHPAFTAPRQAGPIAPAQTAGAGDCTRTSPDGAGGRTTAADCRHAQRAQ